MFARFLSLLAGSETFTYDVEKVIFPFGPDDPVTENFEIRIRAHSRREATIRAANIGKACRLMLVSRT